MYMYVCICVRVCICRSHSNAIIVLSTGGTLTLIYEEHMGN